MNRRSVALLTLAGLICVEGLVAARIGFASFAFQSAVLTLAAGWIMAGSGLVAWHLAPASRAGLLLVGAGATSFLGAFEHVRWDLAAEVATRLSWIHVALLAHAVLTQPDGRIRTAATGTLVAGMYALALVAPAHDAMLLAVGLAAAIAVRRWLDGPDPRRGSADLAGLIAACGLAGGPLLDAVAPGVPLNGSALRLAGVAAAAVLVAADTVRRSPARTQVTDAVVRLDRAVPINVVEALRRATGDPTLEVGFRTAGGSELVDPAGRRVTVPAPRSGRMATTIEWAGRAGAVVIHDERLDTVAALSTAGARAIELASANARLQAELRAQVADVRASRRRIVLAGDAARNELEHRLAAGLLPGLDGVERSLDDTRLDAPAADDDALARVRQGLAEVRDALRRLADGLSPGALDTRGLAGALDRLADRCHVPVTIAVAPSPELSAATAATAWFVCSEALTNIAKHAGAAHASITAAARDGRILLVIADDGVGGADPQAGTGLRGLQDRVEALGGTLLVESVAGAGTRLSADLPVAP